MEMERSIKVRKSSCKTVFITHYKPCRSGYADYSLNLTKSIAKNSKEHIIEVWGCKCDLNTNIIEEKQNGNIIIRRLWKTNDILSLITLFKNLIKTDATTIILYYPLEFFRNFLAAPVFNFSLPLLMIPIILLKRIKLILDLDFISKPYLGSLRHIFFLIQILILKLLQSTVKAVIVTRNILVLELLKNLKFDEALIKYIPHGVPETRITVTSFSDISEVRKRFELSGPVILYWGFISRYKGIDYLIRAVKEVIKEFPTVKLIITGDYFDPRARLKPQQHRYLPSLKNLVESLKLNNSVIFVTKFLTDNEIDSLIALADIIVLPYSTKTLSASGVLARVMAHGKPVIVTDCGWFHGYVFNGINGLIVTQRNELALAEAITLILRDEQLRMRLKKNMREIARRLSWENTAKMWLNVLNGTCHDAI